MKTLLSTTALVSTTALALALGLPNLTLAQTTTESATETQPMDSQSEGFLTARGETDLFASELLGMDVYARRSAQDMGATGGQTDMAQGQTDMTQDSDRQMTMMNRADLDNMDNIGQINEIVLSNDGEVRALVVGVGGFLGLGEQDVAITMNQVTIASDQDDRGQMYVVVNTNADMLMESPAYDRTAMPDGQSGMQQQQTTAEQDRSAMSGDTAMGTDGAAPGAAPATADRTPFARPDVVREGYERVEVSEISSEMLVGQTVYGIDDQSVGDVDELILSDSGEITAVIIDFGGFLGFATRQVALNFEELTIMSDQGATDVRVYVDATQEQIEALPEYEPRN